MVVHRNDPNHPNNGDGDDDDATINLRMVWENIVFCRWSCPRFGWKSEAFTQIVGYGIHQKTDFNLRKTKPRQTDLVHKILLIFTAQMTKSTKSSSSSAPKWQNPKNPQDHPHLHSKNDNWLICAKTGGCLSRRPHPICSANSYYHLSSLASSSSWLKVPSSSSYSYFVSLIYITSIEWLPATVTNAKCPLRIVIAICPRIPLGASWWPPCPPPSSQHLHRDSCE